MDIIYSGVVEGSNTYPVSFPSILQEQKATFPFISSPTFKSRKCHYTPRIKNAPSSNRVLVFDLLLAVAGLLHSANSLRFSDPLSSGMQNCLCISSDFQVLRRDKLRSNRSEMRPTSNFRNSKNRCIWQVHTARPSTQTYSYLEWNLLCGSWEFKSALLYVWVAVGMRKMRLKISIQQLWYVEYLKHLLRGCFHTCMTSKCKSPSTQEIIQLTALATDSTVVKALSTMMKSSFLANTLFETTTLYRQNFLRLNRCFHGLNFTVVHYTNQVLVGNNIPELS